MGTMSNFVTTLLMMMSLWGQPVDSTNAMYDLDGDGWILTNDLLILLQDYESEQ